MRLGLHTLVLSLLGSVLSKQNAVILILCRNEDLDEISQTVKKFEDKFNRKFQYPYVFLNEKPFTEEFQSRMSAIAGNRARYGKVESEVWDMPRSIDRTKASMAWKDMLAKGVPYADRESYHNMCRFFSRSFYKHPLLKDYDYYWRIEPHVKIHCDIEEDPFDFLKANNKKYGFGIILFEYMSSISTLMDTTVKFLKNHPEIMYKKKDRPEFLFERGRYNGCHFWTNFEIASLDFFRSKEYNDYVDALEEAGGFYYERWGDAPVHALAVAMLLDKSEIHFFENIGYSHTGITHCPAKGKNCECSSSNSVDFTGTSCLNRYLMERKLTEDAKSKK